MTQTPRLTEAEIDSLRAANVYLAEHPGAVDIQLVAVETIVAARTAARDTEWASEVEALAETFDNENWPSWVAPGLGWSIPQDIRGLVARMGTADRSRDTDV